MEAAAESDRLNREFLAKLEEQQQKAAVDEKQRDCEFFYTVRDSTCKEVN